MFNEHIRQLENRTGLGPTQVARLLGVAYITFAHWRSGLRQMQPYHERHVEALLLLDEGPLEELVRKHVHGS